MPYPSAPEALDYFSYQPPQSRQMRSFEAWPTLICPLWDTMVFHEPDPACESDHLQALDLSVQAIHRPALNVEPEFNQIAIQPTQIDETQELASESSPARPEYVSMTSEAISPRSPSFPNGRPRLPAKPDGVSLNKHLGDGVSKSKQKRNRESAAKHRKRLFNTIDEAWDLLPDDEKRGVDEKRRLAKLERAVGYFRKLQVNIAKLSR